MKKNLEPREVDTNIVKSDIQELQEFQEVLEDMALNARRLLRKYPSAFSRASAYWIPTLESIASDRGSSFTNILDTINELTREI